MELCPLLYGSLDGKGAWENRCMYMYGPVSLLCTRSYHNLVNRLLKKKIHSYHHHFVLEKKNFRHLKCYKKVSDQIRSVAQSCPTLCHPMNRSTPGLPVHHQLPEFTQTHVHRVSDAIEPSHPLSSPSPPAPNPSQHQSLFQ